MTRSLGGEQSLKAEVFELDDGTQMGHCTIKGRSAANMVYGMSEHEDRLVRELIRSIEKFCTQGWNGRSVCVSLAVLEKHGNLRTVVGPQKTYGMDSRPPPNLSQRPPPPYVSLGPSVQLRLTSSRQPLYPTSACPPGTAPYSPQYVNMNSRSTNPGAAVPSAGHMAPLGYPSDGYSRPPSQLPQHNYSAMTMAPASHARYHHIDKSAPIQPPSAILRTNTVIPGSAIEISGLPAHQSESQLRRVLSIYGNVTHLFIHMERDKPGECKGTARARYASVGEALKASRKLDGLQLGSHVISVKHDKEEIRSTSTTLPSFRESSLKPVSLGNKDAPLRKKTMTTTDAKAGSQTSRSDPDRSGPRGDSTLSKGPLVVNGARGRQVNKSTKSKHESESDSDDSDCDDGRDVRAVS